MNSNMDRDKWLAMVQEAALAVGSDSVFLACWNHNNPHCATVSECYSIPHQVGQWHVHIKEAFAQNRHTLIPRIRVRRIEALREIIKWAEVEQLKLKVDS